MNSFYIRHMPLGEIVRRARPFFEKAESKLVGRSDEWFSSVIEAVRGEVYLLSELPKAAELFLDSTPALEAEAKEFLQNPASLPVVESLVNELKSSTEELLASELDGLMKKIAASTGVKGKGLFMPVRAVITGKTHGPELKQIAKQRSLFGRRTGNVRAASRSSRANICGSSDRPKARLGRKENSRAKPQSNPP